MFYGGEIPVFLASITVIAVLLFLRLYNQIGIKDNGKRYPPSLPILPFFGAILRGGITAVPEYFMRSAATLGPVFSCAMGKRMVLVLNGYDSIFDAMAKHAEAFADRPLFWTEDKLINPGQRGIANASYNDVYKKYHKLCLSILKEFGFGVKRVSETRILEEVESMHDEILKHNGCPFYPKRLLIFSTSNFMLSILFGKNFLQSFPEDHSIIVESSAECVANIDMTLNFAPIARFLPIFWKTIARMRNSSERLLNGIEAGIRFTRSNSSEATFVGRFLEIEGTGYNHQDLLYALRDLCLASTETVSATLQWAIVELANHPATQNRIQREIAEIVPGDTLPSLDDKPRLHYTEAVILEIMRRHTVLPFSLPRAILKDTKVLEYDVPKGCMVIPNSYSAHMDSKIWGDPEIFRPERFLDADNNIINSAKVVAFGLGKRSCLGEIIGRQSTFLFLTSLIQRFDIRPPEGQKTISVKAHTAITTAPTHFEVRLILRVKPTQD